MTEISCRNYKLCRVHCRWDLSLHLFLMLCGEFPSGHVTSYHTQTTMRLAITWQKRTIDICRNVSGSLNKISTFFNSPCQRQCELLPSLGVRRLIDTSYQVSVHLAKRFQRRFFKNRPIRNKNCLWRPCLVMDHNLWRLLISSRSVSKHGHHMQFLFLIGRFLKSFLLWNCLDMMNRNLVGSIYMYGRFIIYDL
jgi:hypothetical protein